MKQRFGPLWLTLDRRGGHGGELVTLALREDRHGKPGKRLGAAFALRRAELTTVAFDLLDLADGLLPATTFTTSHCAGTAQQEPWPKSPSFTERARLHARRERTVERYQRLRQRLPILQTAQRVLESCDESSATALSVFLACIERPETLQFLAPPSGPAPDPQ